MKGTTTGTFIALAIAAVIGYIVFATATGRQVPLLSGSRAPFWAVLGLGFLACAVGGIGIGLARTGGSFADPFIMAAAVVGVAILALAVAFAAGARLPLIAGERSAILTLAGLIAAKYVLTLAQGFVVTLGR